MGGAVLNMSGGLLCLPVDDILIPRVLSRLDPLQIWSLRFVCKDFHEITEKYFAVCASVTFRVSHSGSVGTVCLILSKCRRLEALTVDIDALLQRKPVDPCLRALAAASPRLKSLSLSRCCIANTALCIACLSECCEELEVLRLCSLAGPSLDHFLGGILRRCSDLCELELVDQTGIGGNLLMAIRNSPCLRRLTVSLPPLNTHLLVLPTLPIFFHSFTTLEVVLELANLKKL